MTASADLATEADASAITDPATYRAGPPHALFDRLRSQSPVMWVDEVDRVRSGDRGEVRTRGAGHWAVLGHPEVVAAAREPQAFSSALRGPFLTDPASPADLERSRALLSGMDAPEHSAQRAIVTAAFTPRHVRGMREAIDRHATALTERVRAGAAFDAVADLAAELPLLVLADLLGMPRSDRDLLRGWSDQLVGFDDPEFGGGDVAAFGQALTEAFGYAAECARARRRAPRDDLVSHLLQAEVDGRTLTTREFCHLWLLLVVAGNETTRHLLSGTLELVADRPGVAEWLGRCDSGALDVAITELLRWLTPIMAFRRTASAAAELGGARIGGGDKVVLYYVAANRDPRVFADAHRLELGRTAGTPLAFGSGPHYCLGAHLARAEAAALVNALRPVLGRIRRAGPTDRLASNFMNAIKRLPLTIT